MALYSYTLTNILVSVRAILAETTASFWTDAILTAYINEGQRVIAERGGVYRTTKTVNTTNLVRTVSFTGYKCLAVEYNSKALIKITPLQAGHTKLEDTGLVYPQYWFEYGAVIGIDPIPADIYALTLYVADIPTDLSSGTDTPSIPYAFCELLTYYAVSRALEQDKKYGAAMQLMSMFNNELTFMSSALLPNVPSGIEDLRFQ